LPHWLVSCLLPLLLLLLPRLPQPLLIRLPQLPLHHLLPQPLQLQRQHSHPRLLRLLLPPASVRP
jgi:hypothetical protein